MTNKKKDSAASVKSRETGKVYYVVREYKTCLLVRPSWKKGGLPFTLPKSAFAN